MLDLRAVLATLAVHAAGSGLLAGGIILPPTTFCMCGTFDGKEPPLTIFTRQPTFIVDDPVPATPGIVHVVSFIPAEAGCGAGGPVLIPSWASNGLAFRDNTRPLICVAVNAAGRVTAAWLERASRSSKADRKAVAAARQLRFSPGRPGIAGIRPVG